MQFLVSATVFFLERRKILFLAKVLAKVHVDMSKLHCKYVFIVYYVCFIF